MELAIFQQAIKEYTRFRRLLPWLALALACFGLAAVWNRLDSTATVQDGYANVSFILAYRIIALASAIFATAIVGQEVEQRTIVYLLTRPVERWKLLLFRYVAAVIVVAFLGFVGVSLTSLGSYHGLFSNPLLMNDLKAIFIGSMAYCALFLLISLMFNRAMIICLLFAFGWESSMSNMPGDLYRVSILSYLQTIAHHPSNEGARMLDFASGTLSTNSMSETSAWLTLAILVVATVALSLWRFSTSEFIPKEDSE